jgi:putative toxin-antitoxin system antitoxin component (TIGR02293 family)
LNTEERKQLLYRIIPEATYKRRRDKLSAEESGRAERLARIYATAQYVWNSDDDARTFLHTPHPMLQGRTPLDVSMTELGARRVEELLWQLYYGIAA